MSVKTVFIQAAVVLIASIAVGVVHSVAKPISRTLTPTAAAGGAEAEPAATVQGAGGGVAVGVANEAAAKPVGAAAAGDAHSKLPPGTFVTLEQTKQLFESQGAELIDARNADEFAAGAIPGASSLPPDAFAGGNFPELLNFIARDRKIVVYCGGGDCDASLLVALRLKNSGFADVVVFKEGFTGWTAAGLPTSNATSGGSGK